MEGVHHVLPAGRAALEQDERHVGQVRQAEPLLAEQPVAERGDEAPIHREQMPVLQLGRRLVRCGHAKRRLRVVEQVLLDFQLGAVTEADANLRIVRDEARALELTPTLAERYLKFANVNQFTIASAIALWVATFCIVALIFARRRSGAVIALSIVSLSIFAGAVFAIYELDNGSNGRALAIVTGMNVQARVATADNANSVLALPPGSEIRVLSNRGDWIYAALPNNLRGWVSAKSAEAVRL